MSKVSSVYKEGAQIMKACTSWSYHPYTPPLFDSGDIYICRVAPSEHAIHFEYLPLEGTCTYAVFCRERGTETYKLCGTTSGSEFDITGLDTEKDYEFYVESSDGDKSRVRLARTGFVEGTVINYLHPDDGAYAFSGRFLCSPSWVRLPDGKLLASMDVYGVPQNLTLIFGSDDDGKTWHYVSELMPSFWGKLFVHQGDVYMLSCSTEYGDLLIGKSTDGGKTFGMPTVLLRGSHLQGLGGVHKNPQNVVVYKGRIYETFEWGTWKKNPPPFAPVVMSADVNDDLLDANSWHFTDPVVYDESWPGTVKGSSCANIEGTLVVSPDGTMYNIMRYCISRCEPSWGKVIAYKVNTDDPDAPLTYSHTIDFPANESKFMMKYDEVSHKYWSVATRIDCIEHIDGRNLLSLMVSDDLEHWRVAKDIFDYRDSDPFKIGFQYVDFSFEGDDILFQCRTAMNGADNFHNSNYSTFNRIEQFRKYGC